jgi:inositol transport system ATP-binding protein
MDEPTSAITETEVEHLFRIIRDLRAKGVGIVYITHKMNELFEIADELTVFRDGKYIGTHAAQRRDPRRHHPMMVGREITDMFPKVDCPIGDTILEVRT